MPGTNLTRDEAATRASLLDVTSYTVDLDLMSATQPDKGTFGSVTTLEFTCREPGASTFADLVAPTSARSRSTVAASTPRRRTSTAASRSTTSRRPTRSSSRRLRLLQHRRGPAPLRRPRRRPGLPLQPVRGARRPPRLHHLRAARPQVGLHLQRHRPLPLGGRLERRDARAGEGSATARRSGTSRPPSGCRPTSPRSSPASTTRSSTPTRASSAPSRSGHYCRQSLEEHMDTAVLVELTQQSFAFFEEKFDYPYPFGKYDQLYVPEYNDGRDGERRLRDAARRVPPPQPPAALVLRVPRLGDHPRDGAHVVRRPRDDEVVGRPLAQRVVRRVGLLLVRGQRDRVHRRVDRLRQRPQADRLPRRPAAVHAPDRGRQRRPARGRGQLRHDHLRQGRLGAQAARRVGRHGRRSSRACAPTSRSRSSATPSSRTCSPRSRSRRAASSRAGPQEWLQTAGVNTLAPVLRARRRRQLLVVRGRPDRPRGLADPASPPPRHRPVRRRRDGARWSAATTSRSTSRARPPTSPELVGVEQPALLLLNDEDHAYAKIRLDERSLATAIAALSNFEDSLAARPRVGRRLGHDPRRRDAHAATGPTWCWPTSARRPTPGPSPGSRRRPRWRSTATPTPPTAPTSRPTWESGLRELLLAAEPGSDHQLTFARSYAGAAHQRRRARRPDRPARRVVRRRGPRGRPGHALEA